MRRKNCFAWKLYASMRFGFLLAEKRFRLLCPELLIVMALTLLHSERPKLYRVLAVLSAVGLNDEALIRSVFEDNSMIISLNLQ